MVKSSGFSWKQAKIDAVKIKIRRAETMAKKKNSNPDFAIQHPEWIKQAQNNNFTELRIQVAKLVEKQQATAMARRLKVARKA